MEWYKKYRPATLDDIIGQQHVVKTFKKRFAEKNIPQTVGLIGNSGTGKDTFARIIAMHIVCDNKNQETGYPCLRCVKCRDIIDEKFALNVKNKNASDLNVQSIRDLKVDSMTSSFFGDKKVYIITEYQEIADKASKNALVEFENSNPHAHFIYTSMEKSKIPTAVVSRGQTYYLSAVKWEELFQFLYLILEKENIIVPKEFCDLNNATGGLFTIAQHYYNNIRGAISALEQIVEASAWTEKEVMNILNIVSNEILGNLVIALLEKDVNTLFSNNIEWNETLLLEIRSMLLNIFKYQSGYNEKDENSFITNQNKFCKQLANKYEKQRINAILNLFFELNKYSYWHEKLIEYFVLGACNI